MISQLFFIACGGALGALARFGFLKVYNIWGGTHPWGLVVVNVLGAGLMGLFFQMLIHVHKPVLYGFLMVGLLGAFTTFSSLILDVYTLFEAKAMTTLVIYVFLSFGLGIGLFVFGLWIGEKILH